MDQTNYNPESNTLSTDVIGVEQIKKATKTLEKYKAGKKALENKIISNEQWWKLRHWEEINKDAAAPTDPKPASGWLFNCIMSKHADFMDSYPAPVILPREAGDKEEAKKLSSIVPVILEQNEFESTYSDETLYKLKQGSGVYGIFWDNSKLNGLGDISIESTDLLSLFWEPGITEIQDSKNLFYVELVDNEVLEATYPQLKGKLKKNNSQMIKKYILDDHISTEDKSLVIDWYYKKVVDGKKVLHYCKYVDEVVLYATENDTKPVMGSEMQPVLDENGAPIFDEQGLPISQEVEVPISAPLAQRGWYDHGLYPFVVDVLFKEEGTPVGFGFVDVCKNPQTSIDVMNNAIEKSAVFNANPRYFYRQDGSINEEELMNPSKSLVHVSGNLGEDSLRSIEKSTLDGIYVTVLNNKIEELKETAGNRDTANGGTSAGVTAASAIAAMQEQSGKTSRDMIKTTYRAYSKVINMVIELIRQFYDEERQFRILGERGHEEFVSYSNIGIKEQSQGEAYGMNMGYRLPVFDIKVSAQKQTAYSQLSQNELAIQFYNAGFFNPQMTDQVLACLDMMEFDGKDSVIEKIERNGTMYQQMIMMQQQMLQMAQMIDKLQGTNMADMLAASITGEAPIQEGNVDFSEVKDTGESSIVQKARANAQAATSPR